MLANLRDAEDLPSMQPPVTPPSRPSVPRLNEHEVGRTEDGNWPFLTHFTSQFMFSAPTAEYASHLNTLARQKMFI